MKAKELKTNQISQLAKNSPKRETFNLSTTEARQTIIHLQQNNHFGWEKSIFGHGPDIAV